MKLRKDETKLEGKWIFENSEVREDETCKRIKALVNNHLTEIGSTMSGWKMLFIDPDDNRYWELSYPQGNLHGGGPPCLINLDKDYAFKEYGNIDGNPSNNAKT